MNMMKTLMFMYKQSTMSSHWNG